MLDNIKMTDKIFDLIYSAKTAELNNICTLYKCNEQDFILTLKRKLLASNMHCGACNMAVDFLIIESNKGILHNTYEIAIAENILAAAVYYANGCGKDPYYSFNLKLI